MPIRTIVVHQGRDSRSPVRLEAAATLAAQHDAHIIGMFVEPSAAALANMEWAIGAKGVESWLSAVREARDEARATFEQRLSRDELPGEWRAMEGAEAEAVMTAARHGDLTIVGQADPDEDAYDSSLPDDVVLGAGGPVLIIPYAGKFSSVGKRILIAWNGSREAARSVKDALPLIARADKVVVCCVGSGSGQGTPGREICGYLARQGVEAELAHVARGPESDAVDSSLETVGGFGFQQRGAWTYSRRHALEEITVADALLSAAADAMADLLVMGAYGHARLREMVFGGVTRQILKAMTVPVLMSS